MPKTKEETTEKREARSLRDFFVELVGAFRPAAYPAMIERGASAAALYLAGVAALITLALAPVFYVEHDAGLTAREAYFERALPETVVFEDGAASYDGTQPYTHVEGEGRGRSVMIVDTTGETTGIGEEYPYGMLVTDTAVIYKQPDGKGGSQTYTDTIPQTDGRVSARQFYVDQIEHQRWPGFIMLIGLQFIGTGLAGFVLAGLVGVIAYGLEFMQREGRLPISTCFGATARAATPVVITTPCLQFVPASAGTSPLLSYAALTLPLLLFFLLAARGIQACRAAAPAHVEKASASP